MTSIKINDILKAALKVGASDIHLKVGRSPLLRINGKLTAVKDAPKLSEEDVRGIALSMMNDAQKKKYENSFEMDLAYSISGLSRFRINVFQQRGTQAIAIRAIPFDILSFEKLNLPPILEKIANEERGLVICTGTTGSGKSTTLASMVDYINKRKARHIMTIEDPLEYTHMDRKSYINQREIGIDT